VLSMPSTYLKQLCFQCLMQFSTLALLIVTIKLISESSSGHSGETRRSRLRFYDTSNEAYTGRGRGREQERGGNREINSTELNRFSWHWPQMTISIFRLLKKYNKTTTTTTRKTTTAKHLRINQKMRKT